MIRNFYMVAALIALMSPAAASAQQPYWVDATGAGRGSAELEASKSACALDAAQAYSDFTRDQEGRYGLPLNAFVTIARAAAAEMVQERAFYGCMGRDGWAFMKQ